MLSAPPTEDAPPPPPTLEAPAAQAATLGHDDIARALEHHTPPLGPVGGVGLGLVGGGLTATLAILFASGDVSNNSPTDIDLDALPRGYAWVAYSPAVIVAGVASTAIGVAMLTVDLTTLARRRRAQTLRLHLDLSSDRAGLGLRGRF